jgi:hypothetical protein
MQMQMQMQHGHPHRRPNHSQQELNQRPFRLQIRSHIWQSLLSLLSLLLLLLAL